MNAGPLSEDNVRSFIETILGYVDHDLNELERLEDVCYPTIMLVFAAMEFLGSLAYGFNKRSRKTTSWFINEYMGRVNHLYRDPNWESPRSLCGYLYSFVRSSLVHNASLYENIGMAAGTDLSKYHLHRIETEGGTEVLFIHPGILVQEFRQAKALFLREKLDDPSFLARASNYWDAYQKGQGSRFPVHERLAIISKFPYAIPDRTWTTTSRDATGPSTWTPPQHLIDQSVSESNS